MPAVAIAEPRAGAGVILALGGHEFKRRAGNEAIIDVMLGLVRPQPRVCLLPTASGDAEEQIASFRALVGGRAESLSHLSLFRLEHERLDIRAHLLSQDLIYVGGGSMLNLLAVWSAHGIAEILIEAWRAGVVLAGQSAGAMCWFEQGISRSAGGAAVVRGLGLVRGTLSAHYHRDADRRDALLREVRARGSVGYGVDDGAGLVIRGGEVVEAISGSETAGAWRVERAADGTVTERALETVIPPREPASDQIVDEVGEMRAVRASRMPGGRGGQAWPRRSVSGGAFRRRPGS